MARLLRSQPPQPNLRDPIGLQPLAVVTTPGQLKIRTSLAAVQRRVQERRLYPLPGSTQQLARETGYTAATPATNLSFVQALQARRLGPKPPTVVGPLPSQQLQTVTVRCAADARRRIDRRLYPLPGHTQKLVRTTGQGTAKVVSMLERRLGPKPPQIQGDLPTGDQTNESVFFTRAIQNRLSRIRREPLSRLSPPTVVLSLLTADQTTEAVFFTRAVQNRLSRGRRFPLPGWREVAWLTQGVTVLANGDASPSSALIFGALSGGTAQRRAQSLPITQDSTLASLAVVLAKSGAPVDDVVVQIQTDSGGLPSEVVLGQATVPNASLSGTAAGFILDFGALPLPAGSYWIVFTRSGAFNNAADWTVQQSRPSNSGNGAAYAAPSGPWAPSTGTPYFTAQLSTPSAPGSLPMVEPYLGVRRPQAVTFPPFAPLAVELAASPARSRARLVRASLPLVIVAGTASFVAPPLSVNFLLPDRLARRHRRMPPPPSLTPPTVLQTFGGPVVNLLPVDRLGRRHRRHNLTFFLSPPTVVDDQFIATPVEVNFSAASGRRRRRVLATALSPPTVLQTFKGPQTYLVARGRRAPYSKLPTVIVAASGFVAAPVAVYCLTPDRLGRRHRRQLPGSALQPPTALQVFAGPAVKLVRSQPRPTVAQLAAPLVVRVPAVEQDEQTITVALVRTRPRPTTRTLSEPTVLETFPGAAVTLTSTRPRHTLAKLAAPTVVRVPSVEQQEDTIRVALAHTRPRRTVGVVSEPTTLATFAGPFVKTVTTRPRHVVHQLQPPTVVRVPSVEQAEDTIRVTLARVRPRPTRKLVAAPAVLQTFTGAAVHLTATRPRPTTTLLTPPTVVRVPSVEQQEDTIRVALSRVRPRPTRRLLAAPTVLQTFPAAAVHLTATRPRPTVALLTPPTVVRVPAVEQAEQTVKVTLVRARPRPTRKLIAAPTVLQTFAGPAVHLVDIRPRPTITQLGPPTVVRVPSVEQQEDTVKVVLVRARPRRTHSQLAAPTALQTFPFGKTSLARARPRPTRTRLAAPAVLQVFEAGSFTLTRVRPPARSVTLNPPTVVRVPSVEQQEDTIKVTLVRARPRPTAAAVAAPTTLSVFSGPTVELTRTRPRPKAALLSPPTVVDDQFIAAPVRVTLAALADRLFPRPARHILEPPVVVTPRAPVETLVHVTVVHTRPRPTVRALYPPTALRVFTGPEVTLTQTRPRPTIATVREPLVVRVPQVEQLEQTIRVTLVRARPRPTLASLHGPAALEVFDGPAVHLVETRPRPTGARLHAPTVLETFATGQVSVVRTRPRPTSKQLAAPQTLAVFEYGATSLAPARRPQPISRLSPPTAVAAARVVEETAVHVSLTSRRVEALTRSSLPSVVFKRPVVTELRTVLAAAVRPRVQVFLRRPVAAPPTVTEIRVTLAQTRPRPTTAFLRPPTTLKPVQTTLRSSLSRTRPRPTLGVVRAPRLLRPPETRLHLHLTVRVTRPAASTLRPPTVVIEQPVETTVKATLAPAGRRFTHSHLGAPAVVAPRVPVETTVRVTLAVAAVRAAHQPVQHIQPPILPIRIRRPGFASGIDLPSAVAAGTNVLGSAVAGSDLPTGKASSRAVADTATTINDVPAARAEGDDERSE